MRHLSAHPRDCEWQGLSLLLLRTVRNRPGLCEVSQPPGPCLRGISVQHGQEVRYGEWTVTMRCPLSHPALRQAQDHPLPAGEGKTKPLSQRARVKQSPSPPGRGVGVRGVRIAGIIRPARLTMQQHGRSRHPVAGRDKGHLGVRDLVNGLAAQLTHRLHHVFHAVNIAFGQVAATGVERQRAMRP